MKTPKKACLSDYLPDYPLLDFVFPLFGLKMMKELVIGDVKLEVPVIFAPMAGVSNPPGRIIAYEFGAGLAVSEMVMSRGIKEGIKKTIELACFSDREPLKCMQLYGCRPEDFEYSASWLQGKVDIIDINIGCPVPKVFKNGCGARLLDDIPLLGRIMSGAVKGAGKIPVTGKLRLGIDIDSRVFIEAGKALEDAGCSAVALHARYAKQFYQGEADWSAIAELKQALSVPVIGNGDIWEPEDAIRMFEETGCDGVMVARGALGRPWIFAQIADMLKGGKGEGALTLDEIADLLRYHYDLLKEHVGEKKVNFNIRKWGCWYSRGFKMARKLRARFNNVDSREDLEEILKEFDGCKEKPMPGTHCVKKGRLKKPYENER